MTDTARTEDQALVAKIVRHDRIALEQLYHRHSSWLIARLASRCSDPDLVDLAVQDTFVAVWKSAKKYRGDGDVGAWIWGIAVRRLIDQTRKRRPVPVQIPPEGHNSFEEELLSSGAYGAVGDSIRRLDPDLQAVLVLTAIDGLTTREVSKFLGIPQGTVKTRLMRARKLLQADLQSIPGGPHG